MRWSGRSILSDKLRVHTLSKELGVTSKAIIAKCKSEDVEGVTNHMSTVSAGLAETIREWFSEESLGTAVEEAAPVDLKKVRVKKRTARKKKAEEAPAVEAAVAVEEKGAADEEAEVSEAAVAVAEPEEEVKKEEPAAAPMPPVTVTAEPIVTEPLEAEPPTEEILSPEAPPEAPEVIRPAAEAPEPAAPKDPVKVAGPQNVPAPAQMKGPQVVGFARPDPIARPAPRSMPTSSGAPESPTTPARRGGKGKGPPREESGGKRSRHRANPRRSGTSVAEVGERLREWRDRDLLERQERLDAATGSGIHARRAREKKTGGIAPRIAPRKTKARVTEPIVVHELGAASGIGMLQIIPKLQREHGMGMVGRNTTIPTDIAQLVMVDFGVDLEIVKAKSKLDKLVEEFEARERKVLKPRPPVVTMLGHVDHGKTSLLDRVRKTSVADGEAGGITQHVGAYRVERDNLSVTFLDTPGHEAFTAMRARGANMTDVVVLVLAADDGVMPQTIEAINHAKAAKVTMVVALNKIDLPGLDLNRVYAQLAEHELAPVEWGGEIDVVKTSATTGEGVDELIEHLATLSELLALQADPTLPATGAVIEAEMKVGMGPLSRMLVQSGTLKRGDFVVCGPGYGRVRTMRDDRGRTVKEAGPGVPVEVAGLDAVPNAGDRFFCVDSLQRAKQIADEVKEERRQDALTRISKPQTLEDLFQQRESGEIPELNLILRADTQGSVDALTKSLSEIPSEEVRLTFLHTGIGGVSESDVVLADASGALVVGFNVTADPSVQRSAEVQGVDIRLYRVIYEVIDDIRGALEGLLPRLQTEESRGKAEVREIFHVSKVGMVAGCMVTDGVVGRSHCTRVIRDGAIIVPTEDDVRHSRHRAVGSLRRFKDDAREVRAGMECGIRIERFDDVKPGDLIETYEVIETARTL